MGQVSQVSLTQPRMGEEQLGGLENLGMAGTGPQPIDMLPEQDCPSLVFYPSTFGI